MQTAQQLPNRIARIENLTRITGSWSQLYGVSGLPTSVRPWIFWLTALLKCGYAEIRAPIWAITKSHFQSCSRTTCSDRSTRRALAWLEEHGYISRKTLRIGRDSKGVIIEINIDRFEFFLRPRTTKPTLSSVVVSSNDMCESYLHLPSCPGDKVTSNTNSLEIQSSASVSLKGIKSNKDASKKQERKKHNHHPIIHTLWLLTRGQPAQSQLLFRARRGIAEMSAADPVDWGYYENRWPTMTHRERESAAAREIIPKIGRNLKKNHDNEKLPDINELVSALCGAGNNTKESKPPKYQYNSRLSAEQNLALMQKQKDLFWARQNSGLL